MPPTVSIVLSYLIIIFILYRTNSFINKNLVSKVKDLLAQISVFLLILVNAINLINKESKLNLIPVVEEKSDFISKNILETLTLMFEQINLTYTIPILFSIPTIILLAIEHTSFASQTYKHIKGSHKKSTRLPLAKSERVIEGERIVLEIKLNIAESRRLLNKLHNRVNQ